MPLFTGYRIGKKIYESPSSLVYRGRLLKKSRPVILKVLKQGYPSPAELTRYRQEYEITRSLDVEGVVKAYGIEKFDSTLVIILEDFGGTSLDQVIARKLPTLEKFLSYGIQIAEALGEIHARLVIHKDINPANIVLNQKTGRLKIIDFGISTRLSHESHRLVSPSALVGSLAYMSPEQTGRLSRSLDYRTDIYSLGVTFYQMLTGRLPFEANTALEMVHSHIARQETPVHELRPDIPLPVSQIVTRMMVKNKGDRYRSSWGVRADLETCLASLEERDEIETFALGGKDAPEHFEISHELYGREKDLARLIAVFERACQGHVAITFVAGYSGIGKTALVHELYRPLTEKRGRFIAGKFDQLHRNIPFSAFTQTFRELTHQLLTEDEESLAALRKKLLAVVGTNGAVLIEIIPELVHVLGPQPPVGRLGPAEARARFNLVFQSFLRVLSGPGHPLVIFLDDLQWIDAASLNLIELILTDRGLSHLFLIGSYRGNEVGAGHPVLSTRDKLLVEGVEIHEIELGPLNLNNLEVLIRDSLRRDDVEDLAALVLDKTGGNPFFVNQFLSNLHAEGLLTFNPRVADSPGWVWDMPSIEAMSFTDNVVDLVIGKLKKLPDRVQHLLRLASCLGNRFELKTLALIANESQVWSFEALLPCVREGLVLAASDLKVVGDEIIGSDLLITHFTFTHDRIQQSAYALIEPSLRQQVHLRLGRLLLSSLDAEQKEARIFELVDHLNMGRALIDDDEERVSLAQLNLAAGRRAKRAIAYEAACRYLAAGIDLLPANRWDSQHQLSLSLYRERAETEYLHGDHGEVERLVQEAVAHAHTELEKADLYGVLIAMNTMLTRYETALDMGRKALALFGIDMPGLDRVDEGIASEMGQVGESLQELEVAGLIRRKRTEDREHAAALELLTTLNPTCYLVDPRLYILITLKTVKYSLLWGHIPASGVGYACYGMVLCNLGQYERGFEFVKLAMNLCDSFENTYWKSEVCFLFQAFVNHWWRPLRESNLIADEGYRTSLESGHLQYVGYNLMFKTMNLFAQGHDLSDLLTLCDDNHRECHRTNNLQGLDIIGAAQVVIGNLAGETKEATVFASRELTERKLLANCHEHQSFIAICDFFILKAQALYLHGYFEEALEAAREASKNLDRISTQILRAEYHFYLALILIARHPMVPIEEKELLLAEVREHASHLETWTRHSPVNFGCRSFMLEAEIAMLNGKNDEALTLYDSAINEAEKNQFIQIEAIANERAALLWFTAGRAKIARAYLRDALLCYQTWGAERKVRLLKSRYPRWLAIGRRGKSGPKSVYITTGTRAEELDLESVMKAAATISSEIVLVDLLRKVMHFVIQDAGAQKGCLLAKKGANWLVLARGDLEREEAFPDNPPEVEDELSVPLPIINYVYKTQEAMVLSDAGKQGLFSTTAYIREKQPKSLCCVPVFHQGKLVNILYLENSLNKGVFTTDRVRVLRLLSSQLAISLENARLYGDLEEYNRNLEKKVVERTGELADRNETILRAQNQLITQEKMASMGVLSAGIAHELRNPLNFVINFSETTVDIAADLAKLLNPIRARMDPAQGGEFDELLEELKGNAARIRSYGVKANQIVGQMIAWTLASEGTFEEIEINELVENYTRIAFTAASFPTGMLLPELEVELDPGCTLLRAKASNLSRVIVNLVNNATEAVIQKQAQQGPDYHGRIRVFTRDMGTSLEIGIWDNGAGISEGHMPDLFTPFFTTKPERVGLGLSISYNIVTQEHGGELKVDSRLGDYTKALLLLPKEKIRR